MSYVRGDFGIEYNPRPPDEETHALGFIIALVVIAAAVSAGVGLYSKIRERMRDGGDQITERVETAEQDSAAAAADEEAEAAADAAARAVADVAPPPTAAKGRSRKVRNLLMRLTEAEKSRNFDLAVATIEELRSQPGSEIGDLDGTLAEKLGELNSARLFELKSPLWVKEVTVKKGDFATRIATENGSTLASLMKLNGLRSADVIRPGMRLKVMNHPTFVLQIHRSAKVADLTLGGRFFRRYEIASPVKLAEGRYETAAGFRKFCHDRRLEFALPLRNELETLLPAGTAVVVSEL